MSTYSRPGVYVSESLLPATRIQNAATANAAGAAVGVFPKGPTDLTLVSSWYDFTSTYGGLDASYPSTYQIQSFFANGGRELYVVRLLASDAAASTALLLKDGVSETAVTLLANHKGADTNNLRVTVAAGTGSNLYDITISEVVTGVSGLVPREFYADVTPTVGVANNIADVINADSKLVTATVNDAASVLDLTTYEFAGGTNGSAVTKSTYVPAVGDSVFAVLSQAARPLVVFLPSMHSDVTSSADRGEIFSAADAWCQGNYSFLVADTPKGMSAAQAVTAKGEVPNSAYSAMYWPNLLITDPLGRSRSSLRTLSPAGSVAGLFLATDASRGVFKTPAGLETDLSGVVALETALTSSNIDALYAGGVNAIRQVPGAGFVVMGGKTAKKERHADQNVAVRRSLNYLEKSLKDITEFAVFENNNPTLWARLNTACTVFLGNYWRAGGLAGATEPKAFYVKCDAENNTVTTVQNGEVHIEVGVAVQYPAEFIVIRLSQQAGV